MDPAKFVVEVRPAKYPYIVSTHETAEELCLSRGGEHFQVFALTDQEKRELIRALEDSLP